MGKNCTLTLNPQNGFINLRGTNHYYEWIANSEVIGNKPIMVFIHGWGGSCRYWHSTAKAIANKFDCLLYDLRGFGRSNNKIKNTSKVNINPINLSYNLEEYAHDLFFILEALNINKVYLNAHSMGASIATYFINLYPQKVYKSILNCNGIFEYNERAFKAFHKFGSYVVKFRYNWFLNIPFAEDIFISRFLYRSISKKLSREFLEDFLLADYDAALGTIFASVNKQMVERMPKEFARISLPTLFISGEKDKIIPAEMARQAVKLNNNLNYIEIPKTAHFPMLEAPNLYLKEINSFL